MVESLSEIVSKLEENSEKIKEIINSLFSKWDECEKRGHPGERILGYINESKVYCQCTNCGDMYDRHLTEEEYRMVRKINTL